MEGKRSPIQAGTDTQCLHGATCKAGTAASRVFTACGLLPDNRLLVFLEARAACAGPLRDRKWQTRVKATAQASCLHLFLQAQLQTQPFWRPQWLFTSRAGTAPAVGPTCPFWRVPSKPPPPGWGFSAPAATPTHKADLLVSWGPKQPDWGMEVTAFAEVAHSHTGAGWQPATSLTCCTDAAKNLPGGHHPRQHLWADVACASLCLHTLLLFRSLASTARRDGVPFAGWRCSSRQDKVFCLCTEADGVGHGPSAYPG